PHPVLGLDVPNDRLDRGAATHLAADRRGDAAHLAADPDAEFLGVVVAAITLVDVDATGLDPGQRFQLGNYRPPGGAVEGIAVRFGVQHKLAAFRLAGRGRHRHLAAELIWRAGFAFADAFDLRGVQRIDLGAALPVILKAHPHRQGEQVGKAFLEGFVARDLAPDIADHAAQPNAQKLELAPGPLELVRMRVAPDHERGALS